MDTFVAVLQLQIKVDLKIIIEMLKISFPFSWSIHKEVIFSIFLEKSLEVNSFIRVDLFWTVEGQREKRKTVKVIARFSFMNQGSIDLKLSKI